MQLGSLRPPPQALPTLRRHGSRLLSDRYADALSHMRATGLGQDNFRKAAGQELPALRLTGDEWLHALYPGISTPEAETGPFRSRVERLQWSIALRSLEIGCDVVLDWGVWAREERDLCRAGAREVGARVVLCVFDPSIDELWNRLSRRNADRPIGTFEISKAVLLRWSRLFQRPNADELALYDPWEAI